MADNLSKEAGSLERVFSRPFKMAAQMKDIL